MKLSLESALIAILVMALVTLATRAFPFILFSRRKPPAILRFIEQYIPPMVMAVLVIYCLKDISWKVWPSGIREIISLVAVTLVHLAKKNAMLSIFGGTALYMLLGAFFVS